ncbi:MAG: 50S ribosome-binding GTPase [Cellulomonas sp.]|nr:50S ribosome-binding GTPase [Cellulomonas sp.]
MSCHEPAAGPVDVATRHAIVALVGAPNVGKSTLFNAATGARQHVVNAPGTTVELATGAWRAAEVELVDLPGAYSLLARTPDEQVTADAVAGRGAAGDVDLVVAMVDATAVARSLYLVGQVARAGKPVVVALTMRDVAAGRGIILHVVRLPEAKKGFVPLPRRWVVERSFGWMSRFRRLARDYERLATTLAGLHYIAFSILMLQNAAPILEILSS